MSRTSTARLSTPVFALIRARCTSMVLTLVPSLWAALHHRAAVAALAAHDGDDRPDGIVFLNGPGELPAQHQEEASAVFLDVLAAFRATYRGPITVTGPAEQHTAQYMAAFARLSVATLPEAASVVPGWRGASIDT